MSWLRLDDGFTKHPKFEGWTAAQRWAWLEVLEYCSRYQTGGRIPDDLSSMPRSTTPQLLRKAEQSGLIDRVDNVGKVVHDWAIYNAPTVTEKVASYLESNPQSTANEVHKAIGGTRTVVLAEVAKYKATSQTTGTAPGSAEPLDEPGKGGSEVVRPGGSETGSESGSHAREPVPSPKRTNSKAVTRPARDPAADTPEHSDHAQPEPDGRPSDLFFDIHPPDLEDLTAGVLREMP